MSIDISHIEAPAADLVANGVRLHYRVAGDGEPIVLVHGSWTDHQTWQFVVPQLAESFRVVWYDRRGHSASEHPTRAWRRRDDEDDLAALITRLDVGPVHLVASSYGAAISLALAARRPDLVRSVIAHEPPLLDLVTGDAIDRIVTTVREVADRVTKGDAIGAARYFVDELVLGPGWWDRLPPELHRTFVDNAPTFAISLADPDWSALDADQLERSGVPVLLTDGTDSPPWLPIIVRAAADRLPSARRLTFAGSGHAPHLSDPAGFVGAVREQIGRLSATR